jgi:hypothetical protein
MFTTVEKVKELLAQGKSLILAGDESLLRALPRGTWIGGTIPYFMTGEGGRTSHEHIFVCEVPAIATGAHVTIYDEASIPKVFVDSPYPGYTILILPAFTPLHQCFALDSPLYEQQFFKVVAGWIAGTSVQEIGQKTPKVFAGTTGEVLEDKGVAMHVALPSTLLARIGIVNIFEPSDGEEIQFPESGFQARECIVAGKRENVVDYLTRTGVDLRLPLVSDMFGTKVNVSIQSLDLTGRVVKFFAPVFKDVGYRPAKPVSDYSARFLSAIPAKDEAPVFSCNCVLNYLYGQLEGRTTGTLQGPMTFGEIAYQLLNQTLVQITLEPRP